MSEYCKNCYELTEKLERKEQECEELKAKIKYMKEYIKTVENARNEFEKESKFLKEESKRLKQTLTEIKELAERNHKTKEELFKIRHSRLTKFSMGALNGRHNLASEILQKISECEGNNEN